MFRKKNVVFPVIVVVFVFFVMIHYLLLTLENTQSQVSNLSSIEELIFKELKRLPEHYKKVSNSQINTAEVFIKNLGIEEGLKLEYEELQELWREANKWASKDQITNIASPYLGAIMLAMKTARITKADIDPRGTQLKLLLDLQGGQQVVFKPKWYNKDKVIEGPVYAGKDRYSSEIVAFYLSVLLEKLLSPVSVKRTISIKYDILPVATKRLLNTTFEKNGKNCVYGKCFYCKKEDPICENDDYLLIGAVIFNVKKAFSNFRSPWQRTYKKHKKAVWEEDSKYCNVVRSKLSKKRILDLIDTAIFDFLIQNGDRHHYETLYDIVIWIDNGKGLGNPFVQHTDILAPLYQCCIIREKTWKALLNLAGGNLRRYLSLLPDIDSFLTEDHLKSMEERLMLVFATVEYCKKSSV